VDEFGRTLGEELLTPTRIYALACLDVTQSTEIHAMSHITGGGLANNLARVMPQGLAASIDRSTWTPAPIFAMVQQVGRINQDDIEETLNMGVGMVMICLESSGRQAIDVLASRGVDAWDAGVVETREPDGPAVRLYGQHP
jgi:phosphoribosylformylglycinamidine cyclo-ligase